MAVIWILRALALVLLLSSRSNVSGEGSWCYDRAECGPSTWSTREYCNGKRQSPIDIQSGKAVRNSRLEAITLTGYDDNKKLLEAKNTGKTVDFELGEGLRLSGRGLPAPYAAKSFHLHWGNGDSKPGSEHYIDNRRYSMELHIVHTKNNMSMSDALKDPEGIAVLGFFIEGSRMAREKTAEAWEALTKNLKKVSEKGKDVHLDSSISLLDLLGSPDLTRYYRYPGSLTTPNCNEVVIWTIFPDPILVPPKVLSWGLSYLHHRVIPMPSGYRRPTPLALFLVEGDQSQIAFHQEPPLDWPWSNGRRVILTLLQLGWQLSRLNCILQILPAGHIWRTTSAPCSRSGPGKSKHLLQ